MSLSDGDVAVLARQAVDLLSTEIGIDLVPAAGDDPYRWGRSAWLVWPLLDGGRTFGIYLESEQTPAEALRHLIDQLSENIAQTVRFGTVLFPACPEHAHSAEVAVAGDDVVLRCPETGREVRRIAPDLPV